MRLMGDITYGAMHLALKSERRRRNVKEGEGKGQRIGTNSGIGYKKVILPSHLYRFSSSYQLPKPLSYIITFQGHHYNESTFYCCFSCSHSCLCRRRHQSANVQGAQQGRLHSCRRQLGSVCQFTLRRYRKSPTRKPSISFYVLNSPV
jgi:hypothetical protein